MAGGINNFGTTIGPLLVSFAIFGTVAADAVGVASIESVKIPYLILGAVFLLLQLFSGFLLFPIKLILKRWLMKKQDSTEKVLHSPSALKYPQLVLGMIGIFVYVGVEVSTASNLPAFYETTFANTY